MRTIEIRKISVTALDTDAIVNAANEGLLAGGGVCGAIFKAAGYHQLQEACNQIGHCDTGSAVITPGFNLRAKYIIHAVGPRWKDGTHREPEQLYGAYYKALELATASHCKSIGFPLISAGIFGYPVPEAWRQALSACGDFLRRHKDLPLAIVFAVLDDEIIKTGRKALRESNAAQYRIADRDDWKTVDMPQQRETFILRRAFTPNQMAALRRGNIPQAMEDKWFWFMEGDTLFAHRSWSGFCVYRIDFKPDNQHLVTVNRDPEQYSCRDAAEDVRTLNKLLDWWTEDSYDFHNAWLSETVDALEKAGRIPDTLTIAGRKADAVFRVEAFSTEKQGLFKAPRNRFFGYVLYGRFNPGETATLLHGKEAAQITLEQLESLEFPEHPGEAGYSCTLYTVQKGLIAQPGDLIIKD